MNKNNVVQHNIHNGIFKVFRLILTFYIFIPYEKLITILL